MAIPFNAVNAAYTNASKLITDAAKTSGGAAGKGAQGTDFGKVLADQMQGMIDQGKKSDQMSLDMLNGKANVVDVVTAISQTQLAMESMVAVRDKVISAYEEIMRMPI
jgi:flagellar hook-basal body complex protein FliE